MRPRRIGILTCGGDAPGLNAVIRAVVKTATSMKWSVVGIEDGFEGLLGEARTRTLTVIIGFLLPFTPLGALLGFVPLPGMFFLFLTIAAFTYLLFIEAVKRRLMQRLLN